MNNKKEDKPNRQVAEQGNSIPKKRKKKGKKESSPHYFDGFSVDLPRGLFGSGYLCDFDCR